mmetsp:Transcript_91464/g.259022  ORF Transcript_91464/g.259022 Transcript_91464/m.259022 type:complete len:486 (-) Transcript_91464:42-1499(-)
MDIPSLSSYGTVDKAQAVKKPSFFSSNAKRALAALVPTFVVLAGAEVIDCLDGKVLGCALRALERSFGLSPPDMACVAFVGTASRALGAPLWGVLSDRCDRRRVLAAGCLCWALASAGLGCAPSFAILIVVRAANGVALASLTPVSQSLLADLTVPEIRGTCFGCFGAVGYLGEFIADNAIPSLAGAMVLGFEGWRVTCLLVACLSLAYVGILLRFLRDPKSSECRVAGSDPGTSVLEGIKTVFCNKTYLLICLQGVFGSMPYSCFGFLLLWLQYLGLSNSTAGLVVSMKASGAVFGTVLAGLVGDWAAHRSPDHGRIIVAQAADFLRVPLLLVLFLVLPGATKRAAPFGCTLACLGVLMPFPSIACSKPLFAEVVRPELRGSIVAWQTLVEGSLGALGAVAVGRLAQTAFHYQTSRVDIGAMPESLRQQNANALGHALVFTTTVPWMMCTLLYGCVHFTYKYDRDRVESEEASQAIRPESRQQA